MYIQMSASIQLGIPSVMGPTGAGASSVTITSRGKACARARLPSAVFRGAGLQRCSCRRGMRIRLKHLPALRVFGVRRPGPDNDFLALVSGGPGAF